MAEPVSPRNAGYTVDLGFIVVAAGALTATIATFLPWEESPTFRGIENNTYIQQGGWAFVAVALAAAGSAYRVGSGRSDKWWVPLIWIGLSALLLFIQANQVSRTLYPVKIDGTVDTSGPGVTGSLGIAVYVAWLGVALMVIGTRFLYDATRRQPKKGIGR